MFGWNLRAVLVMRSSPGAFFLRMLRIMFWMVPGVVKRLGMDMKVLIVVSNNDLGSWLLERAVKRLRRRFIIEGRFICGVGGFWWRVPCQMLC